MQNGIYNALFGALTQEYRMDVIANNLANAGTAGFKRQKTAFEDVMNKRFHNMLDAKPSIRSDAMWPAPTVTSQARIGEVQIDFSPGGMRQTGNPLDLAIHGNGFFKIDTDRGTMYTRNGQFQVMPDGTVTNARGDALLGEGGPVVLPEGGGVVIGGNGEITVAGEVVNTIDLVAISEPQALEKFGENLFRIREGVDAGEQPPEDAEILQGFLEESNVTVVQEMVSMIDTMRVFESYQKIMTSVQDEDKKVINEVGNTTR